MRTIIILLLTAFLCSNIAFGQHSAAIPAVVTSAFARSYPKASGTKWDNEGKMYEANFKNNNQEMSVTFDGKGAIVETETPVAINALPVTAAKYASAKGKIREASKIVLANGTIRYEAEVNGKDLLFDERGKFIEEKTETDDKD